MQTETSREPVVGENRQEDAAEHGLGAGLVKILACPGCARHRVNEADFSANQGGTA